MLSTSLAIGMLEVTDMLHMRVSSVIVLPDGALAIENEADKSTVSAFKGVGLNLAAFLREALHLLQDGVIAELRAHEHRTLQMFNEQMTLQRNAAITTKAEATI